MDRRSWLSLSLVCCVSLLTIACSFTRFGKTGKDTGSAAGPGKSAKQLEATYSVGAEEVGKERKWENYETDSKGVGYYVERGTLAYPSKTLVRAWRKRIFPTNSPQKEIISFDEIDCNEARYRSLVIAGVYWDGTTKTFKVVSPWVRIYADSPDEVLYLDVCKTAENRR